MMADSPSKPVLHVEGKDDEHAIVHLLIRNRIDSSQLPWVEQAGSVENLLEQIEEAVMFGSERPVGLVLDADSPLSARWEAVRDRLRRVGVSPPDAPLAEGFIGSSAKYGTRVGVWLMPDNQHDGKLETLLRTLVEENDPLIGHADTSTGTAKALGAKFSDPDREKAVLHAWLAWQKEPGKPYGTAITAQYFRRHDSPAALAFVTWFKLLYEIP